MALTWTLTSASKLIPSSPGLQYFLEQLHNVSKVYQIYHSISSLRRSISLPLHPSHIFKIFFIHPRVIHPYTFLQFKGWALSLYQLLLINCLIRTLQFLSLLMSSMAFVFVTDPKLTNLTNKFTLKTYKKEDLRIF